MLNLSINNGKVLSDAIASLQTIVPKKPSRDIISCIKLVAVTGKGGLPDSVHLQATDLETFGLQIIDDGIFISKEGSCAVPSQSFLDYIKSLEESKLHLRVSDENKLVIEADKTSFELGLQDVEDFPEFPKLINSNDQIDIPLEEMKDSLKKVIFAVAEKSSPRWASLSSVCIEINKGKVSLIGTDQARASIVDIPVTTQIDNKQFLVSAKSISLLTKLFSSSFKLSTQDKNSLLFSNSNSYLYLRLMHGDYPPVKKIIPAKCSTTLEFNSGVILKQAKKASLAADENSSIKIELRKDEISLLTQTRKQRKSAKVAQEIEYSGPDFDFALNCQYLLELLKAFDSEVPLKMGFNKNNQPILFTQNNFNHICVPQETRS